MNKITTTLLMLLLVTFNVAQEQQFSVMLNNGQGRLYFAQLTNEQNISEAEAAVFIRNLLAGDDYEITAEKREEDGSGFVHVRYDIALNQIKLANKRILAHFRDGKLVSLNGDLELPPAPSSTGFILSEEAALAAALQKVGATKYKWENVEEVRHMRAALNDPSFTYDPHGKKVIFEKENTFYTAWQFNIYAEKPLYRANVFVNAQNGEILDEHNLLCTIDVPGTAATKYSGTQTITCDQNGGQYSLRESSRGNGVETYNLGNGTSYGAAVDFINGSSNWTNTGFDQGAADAHWGAEKTYDYFFMEHSRNSINNNGFKLLSYVHYDYNYSNAFWDGARMTYGDGSGSYTTMFASLDICGHEITHGLTDFTSNLYYSYESGALNESFSDIFGAAIENYGRPLNWNWKIGEDVTSSNYGLRNMSNPKSYGDPDTYLGVNWYTGSGDNGGVHTNSGVSNYWFYLLVTGGTGNNDNFDNYSVQGLGMTKAAKIAFRALTVYFTPTTDYAAARISCIQAAKDLYGDCSNEMIQTANAWYAVGVGQQLSASVSPDFTANVSNFCSVPATVSFSNTTPYAQSFTWKFGDGSMSTALNPVHTYTAQGSYNVQLKATGCNLTDSLQKQAFVIVDIPAPPLVSDVTVCYGNSVTLQAPASGFVQWYHSPTSTVSAFSGPSLNTPTLSTNLTYYVNNTYTWGPVFGGIAQASNGNYLTNSSHYLEFDVLQHSTLNSVVVYAGSAGPRTIELRNAANTIVDFKLVYLNGSGAHVVNLDFVLTPGNNYRLGLSSSSNSDLFRNSGGVSYPYNVGGCALITGSSAGAQYYYYFYNWKITKTNCVSASVPVTASVVPLPVVELNTPSEFLCFDHTAPIGTSPMGGVLSGNGVEDGFFNASAFGPGTYTLSYSYTNEYNCSASTQLIMYAQPCTGLDEQSGTGLLIYPNPARDIVSIDGLPVGAQIRLIDANGKLLKTVYAQNSELQLNLGNYAAGFYMLSVTDRGGQVISSHKLVRE